MKKITHISFLIASLNIFCQKENLLLKFYSNEGIQIIAPNLISTNMGEYSPFFDINHSELFFMRRTPNQFDYTIYSSKLTSKGWSKPKVVSFSGTYRDAAPYVSPNGNKIFFDSKRPSKFVKKNSINIWYSDRKDEKWSKPMLVKGASLNSKNEPNYGLDDFGPAVDKKENIYFYSFRNPFRGGAHYVTKSPNYKKPFLLNEFPDPSYNTFVSYLYISPNGKFLLLEGKGKNSNATDLYYTCKDYNNKWIAPIELTSINTIYGEGVPSLTADGKFLLFASNRNSSSANLYITKTKDLFGKCQKKISE